LDQRGQDGGLFSLGHIKCDDEMGDRCSERKPDGSFLCLTVQFEYPHGSFEDDIGILWSNSGEVTGEGDASAAKAEVGNGALPSRCPDGNRGR
jgi:hypothetical protein